MLDVQVADVLVRLPDADEHDGLARGEHERERRAHLVVDRVELGEQDAVDGDKVKTAKVKTSWIINSYVTGAADDFIVSLVEVE